MVGLGQANLLGPATVPGIGNAAVKLLQKSLRALAVKTQNTDCDPSAYDGTFTLGTVVALANTLHTFGKMVDSTVGAASDLIELIKAPFSAIPYGDSVINVILSPWLIDNVYQIILAIIRLFPGGGGVATSIDQAVTAFEGILTSAAGPIATAIALATTQIASKGPPTPPTLGSINPALLHASLAVNVSNLNVNSFKSVITETVAATDNPPPGFTWVVDHWERLRAGQVGVPGPQGTDVTVRQHPSMSTGPTALTPISGGLSAREFIEGVKSALTVDHQPWPKGRRIASDYGGSDWDETIAYSSAVPFTDLSPSDQVYWQNHKYAGHNDVTQGRAAFLQFYGKRGQRMGAFWSEKTQTLKIQRITKKPSKKGHWYDFIDDIVPDFIEDFIESSWDWIKENGEDIFAAIQKYGCLIVNNDIVVATVAAGAGVVASPAASAAVIGGAEAGRGACTVLAVGEAVYAIIKFLAISHDPPPPLSSDLSPIQATAADLHLLDKLGLTVVFPPTDPTPAVSPGKSVFPTPPSMSTLVLTPFQLFGLAFGGFVLGAVIWKKLRA